MCTTWSSAFPYFHCSIKPHSIRFIPCRWDSTCTEPSLCPIRRCHYTAALTSTICQKIMEILLFVQREQSVFTDRATIPFASKPEHLQNHSQNKLVTASIKGEMSCGTSHTSWSTKPLEILLVSLGMQAWFNEFALTQSHQRGSDNPQRSCTSVPRMVLLTKDGGRKKTPWTAPRRHRPTWGKQHKPFRDSYCFRIWYFRTRLWNLG